MQCGAVQVTAADADEAGNAASALLAASQASAQLKASLLQEQQIVSTFLHHFCEKVPGLTAFTCEAGTSIKCFASTACGDG